MTNTIRLIPGAVQTGQWCDEHALSHVAVVNVYALGQLGPFVVGRHEACADEGQL